MKNKKIFTLMMVPLLLVSCSKNSGPKILTRYLAGDEINSKTYYQYNNNGSIREELVESYDNNEKVSEYKTEYSYINEHLNTEVFSSFDETNKKWQPISKTYYIFDEKGNKISEYTTMFDESKETLSSLYAFVFDENNREIREEMYDYYSDSLYINFAIDKEYNSNNLLTKESISTIDDTGELNPYSYNTYTYNEDTTLNKVEEFDVDGNLLTFTEYEYVENTKNIKTERGYKIREEITIPVSKYESEYNSDGKLSKKTNSFYNSETTSFDLHSYEIYEY